MKTIQKKIAGLKNTPRNVGKRPVSIETRPAAVNVPYIFYREDSISTTAETPAAHTIPYGYAFVMREFRVKKTFADQSYAEFPVVNIQFSSTASAVLKQNVPIAAGLFVSPIFSGATTQMQTGDQVTSVLREDTVYPIRDTIQYKLKLDTIPAAAMKIGVALVGYLVPMGD